MRLLICVLFLSTGLSTPLFGAEIHDVSRLSKVQVKEIVRASTADELQAIVKKAKEQNLKISIAGARHSQGGHIFYPGAVVLDMRSFNQVLKIDKVNKLVTVQSGATWAEVQDAVNASGLAIKVMQASNIFTVGGSLSVNAHGRDPKYGSIVETVRSFRLLKASGEIVHVSRDQNKELFYLVIGGYGLFGLILDVELELAENLVYRKTTKYIDASSYPSYFEKNIKGKSDVGLHFAWPSIERKTLLKKILIADYRNTQARPKNIFALQTESGIERNKYLLSLSRKSDAGKSVRWNLQRKLVGQHQVVLSRNNAMRPEVKFLDYESPNDTDILQEYFFPIRNYDRFISELRKILLKEKINLLSSTLRYVSKGDQPFLRYADNEDSFAIVLYINQGLSDSEKQEASRWTRKLVDLSLSVGGNYYLPYQLYPTREQIRTAYPQIDDFFAKKRAFDPQELFINQFYSQYR